MWRFEDVGYDLPLKATTLQHMAALTEAQVKALRYEIVPSVLDEEDRDEKIEDQYYALKRAAYDAAFL